MAGNGITKCVNGKAKILFINCTEKPIMIKSPYINAIPFNEENFQTKIFEGEEKSPSIKNTVRKIKKLQGDPLSQKGNRAQERIRKLLKLIETRDLNSEEKGFRDITKFSICREKN